MKIGIIVADIDEYKPLAEFIEQNDFSEYSFLGRKGHRFFIGNTEVLSLLCGIGKVNAAAATAHFVDIGCDYILNFGLSGGISGVRRGDICIPSHFLEHDFDLTGIGYKPCEKPSQEYIYEVNKDLFAVAKNLLPEAKSGTAVTGDCFVCDETLRNSLKENFNATSCDMETAAIAYVCAFSGVPFLSLRRISDDAGNDAESSYREMNTSNATLLSDYIIWIIKAIGGKKI